MKWRWVAASPSFSRRTYAASNVHRSKYRPRSSLHRIPVLVLMPRAPLLRNESLRSVGTVPLVGLPESVFQGDCRFPSKVGESGNVEKLAGGTVGFGRIEV